VPSGGAGRSARRCARRHPSNSGRTLWSWAREIHRHSPVRVACNEACTWFHLAVDHSAGGGGALRQRHQLRVTHLVGVSASPVVALAPLPEGPAAWESRPRQVTSGNRHLTKRSMGVDSRRRSKEYSPTSGTSAVSTRAATIRTAAITLGTAWRCRAFLGLQRGPMDNRPVLHEGGQGRDEQGRDVEDVTGLVVCSRRASNSVGKARRRC